jgi:hypothetical protein
LALLRFLFSFRLIRCCKKKKGKDQKKKEEHGHIKMKEAGNQSEGGKDEDPRKRWTE